MPGRANYSGQIAQISRNSLESALSLLPRQQRRLLTRTEIERAPHKIVAAELSLSIRQFYRLRAAAVQSILETSSSENPTTPEAIASLPVQFRMMLHAVVNAIEANDRGRLNTAIGSFHRVGTLMSAETAAIAELMLAVGDVAAARMAGDQQRARRRLGDVTRLTKDLQLGGGLMSSAVYGLSAMLSLAEDKLDCGETDAAIALASDVYSVANRLTNLELAIDAQTTSALAFTALPCYGDKAYSLAAESVRCCSRTIRPRTVVRSIRALASSLAELGWASSALALRNVAQPLADTLLSAREALNHRLWCASIELQCGSPARAITLSASILSETQPDERARTAATMIQAHALALLGRHGQSLELASIVEAVSKRQGWRRFAGEARLVFARNAFATSDIPSARTHIAAAIPLLDRTAPASTQQSAYRLSYELTGNPLHAILADAYRPCVASSGG